MLKKLNTKKLLLIFVALILIVALTKIFDDKKGGRTFKEELVNIDTSLVNVILLYPSAEQHKEIKLTKSGEDYWTAQKENISSEADTNYVMNVLASFVLLKPQRLAATEESRWKDYNVDDSLGTRVKLLSGEKTLLDIVVGKFSYNQMSRSGISYVRLYDDEDVYAVDGFLPMTVNQQFNEWRNKNILKGNKSDWNKISFSYPDSSFVLKMEDGRWTAKVQWTFERAGGLEDSIATDSAKIEQYLNELSSLSNSSFVDDYKPNSSPLIWITIEGNNMASPITIKAFPADSVNQFIINSSFNSAAYFSAGKGNLSERIFKGKQNFLTEITVAEEKKGKK